MLEFQECALLVGSLVTLVGELHREVDGRLTLRPWPGGCSSTASKLGYPAAFSYAGSFGNEGYEPKREGWRTSWEGHDADPLGMEEARKAAVAAIDAPTDAPEARIEKVLASDDPSLIELGGDASGAIMGAIMACRRAVAGWKLHAARAERRLRVSWEKSRLH